jgi:hypothetical protein
VKEFVGNWSRNVGQAAIADSRESGVRYVKSSRLFYFGQRSVYVVGSSGHATFVATGTAVV